MFRKKNKFEEFLKKKLRELNIDPKEAYFDVYFSSQILGGIFYPDQESFFYLGFFAGFQVGFETAREVKGNLEKASEKYWKKVAEKGLEKTTGKVLAASYISLLEILNELKTHAVKTLTSFEDMFDRSQIEILKNLLISLKKAYDVRFNIRGGTKDASETNVRA